ncbi:MAG TPA: SCO family protein [Verrucomicrobiae bacterium]|jgi:protein SCO1/2
MAPANPHPARRNSAIDAVLCGILSLAFYCLPSAQGQSKAAPAPKRNPLRDYKFTNELGQPVSLTDFHGQALAVTFFFTRCPMPQFCPRLSQNFQEASKALGSDTALATNWHFLSVTFDPAFDTPAVLKAYGERYQYDPRHWSFLTGPEDKIKEFARLSGVQADPESGTINHNFRTLIIDPANRLQKIYPIAGDLSEDIAAEMRKALAATNSSHPHPAPSNATSASLLK